MALHRALNLGDQRNAERASVAQAIDDEMLVPSLYGRSLKASRVREWIAPTSPGFSGRSIIPQ
ncbi:hypothetical protein LJR235_002435 [Pararhizobium sp. LjRoot235]|uniref:hypothetical protein n=1 Tax=Pararhizobium sp. LjRoot235 TaxID=3342291 RepID=UPI003ECF7F17